MGLFGFGKKWKSEASELKDGPVLENIYCMWMQTEKDKDIRKSKIIRLIDEFYNVVEGNELELFNSIVLAAGGKRLTEFPANEVEIFVQHENNLIIMVSLSKKKGLIFLFNYPKTDLKVIENFLQKHITACKMVNESLDKRGKSNTTGKEWWGFIKKNSEKEAKGAIVCLGPALRTPP